MEATTTRLYQLLVEALRERGADFADRPVTVAEIYQELVPYRTVRENLGVELNADYEHALLKLLAGEAELLRLEPAAARDELRDELKSPNPYVGLYRKFAACDVWLKLEPAALAQPAGPAKDLATTPPASTPAPPIAATTPAADQARSVDQARSADQATTTPPPIASPALAAAATAGQMSRPGGRSAANSLPEKAAKVLTPPMSNATPRPLGKPPLAATPPKPAIPDAAASSCAFCSQLLPMGRTVRFCPHCGGDQSSRPCPNCGEVLEREWRYCIACGSAA